MWGILFFLASYEHYEGKEQDLTETLLLSLYEELPTEEEEDFSYCRGLTGPFWLLHHLNSRGIISADLGHVISGYLPAAISASRLQVQMGNFDFLQGSTGICRLLCAYAEEKAVREHLEFFVRRLTAYSKPAQNGSTLPIFHHTQYPAGADAFSTAHGTCAIQILLLQIHKAGIMQEECRQLVYETLSFMLGYEKVRTWNGFSSLYPEVVSVGGDISRPSRVSWCYGDISVAMALWQCGRYFREQNWMDRALHILHFNSRRNTPELAGTKDACLCHGSAGNAAIYRRFWMETNDKIFGHCADNWYRLTEAGISSGQQPGVYGISSWQGKNGWTTEWDLLNGSAGVGLSLLGARYAVAQDWDTCLLIS